MLVQFYIQPTYMEQFESQNVKSCRLESLICRSPLIMSRNNMNRTYIKITCVAGMRFGKTNRNIFLLGNGLHLKWELGKCDWMASNWVLLFFNVPKRIRDKAALKKKDAWIGGLGIEYRTLKSSGHLFPCIRVKIDSVRGILVAVSGRFRYYLEQKKTLHKFRGQITTKKQWRKNSPRFAEIFQKTET